MREHEVTIPSRFGLAGVLCLPEDASPARPAPAVALLGGSGADTRDGDLEPGWPEGTTGLPAPGTLRRIAHRLAPVGVATLRWDRRGFGASGGQADASDYHSDLEDALAAFEWLRAHRDIDASRVAVAGHSAGALTACQLCREIPDVGGAVFLGALASPIEDMLRWNLGRVSRHWREFSPEQQAWLTDHLPASLVRGEGVQRYLDAARAGLPTVVLQGHGVSLELRTARTRQDMVTAYEGSFHWVRRPALVLHGGDDLNVPVADALTAYRAVRATGNDDVELVVLPRLDHYFNRTPSDRVQRVWERVSLESLRKPMADEALDVIARWGVRVLRRQ
jgi:pimeloyl-ACP methyl ester carboxylesterase